jgi:circadian clock protein KaiB
MDKFILKLFISGDTNRSKKALSNVRKITEGKDYIHLDVIDVLIDSEPAETYKILATPTLIKTNPAPARRVVGDFEDTEKLINFLQL